MTAILLGLFGGAGATVLFELLIKPRFQRRALAEVLAAETSLNISILAGAKASARPDKVPTDFRLSTHVFDALLDQLGALPPRLVGRVVTTYTYLRWTAETPRVYETYVDQLRATPEDAPHRATMIQEIQACIQHFHGRVDGAIDRVNVLQPLLLDEAFPWWTPRRWFRDPHRDLTVAQAANRLKTKGERRRQVNEEIQRRYQLPDGRV